MNLPKREHDTQENVNLEAPFDLKKTINKNI